MKGNPLIIPPIRGCNQYRKFLDSLMKLTGTETYTELSEHALNEIGRQHGLIAPARANPRGTNRFGIPHKNDEWMNASKKE